MKHFKNIFNALLGVVLTLLFVPEHIQAQESGHHPMDSVEISLLTCQPHDEVYSLYGHTAIRYHDLRDDGIDLAFNYGVFNFHEPHFVARFVFGLTNYELGAYPFRVFQEEYRRFGSQVTEQVLNLTADEKQKVQEALRINLLPENRIYRYNYFYNNCTTKARDVIEECINGEIKYADNQENKKTYRDIIHDMTERNPWSRFGNDLLLGIKADQPTTLRQQEFLPNNLMHDFTHATIYSEGHQRPLVKKESIVVEPGVQVVQDSFPLSPSTCGWLLAAIGLIIFLAERHWKKSFVVWDVILMVTTGIIGIVLFLMLFSQHPTVSINLQILLFNPLPWFFLWWVIRRKPHHYWEINFCLVIAFAIGSFFQTYAEGLSSLALCLLLQSIIHLDKKIR